MKKIITEIAIQAPAEKVWSVLMDFDSYPKWNPFIRKIEGEQQINKQLTVSIEPPGKKIMVFKPRILQIIKRQELTWLGNFISSGIFAGKHSFILENISDDHVRFIHSEVFTGLLSKPIFYMIGASTKGGFEQMNKALKERCEHDI